MPDPQKIERVEEPYVKATMMVPNDYVGAVMELCQKKRGNFIDMQYLDANRVSIVYEIPLAEIVYDFFDQLKSNTKGYASFDYELIGYQAIEACENGYSLKWRKSRCIKSLSSIEILLTNVVKSLLKSLKSLFHVNSLKCRFKRQSVKKLWRVQQLKPCVKTF